MPVVALFIVSCPQPISENGTTLLSKLIRVNSPRVLPSNLGRSPFQTQIKLRMMAAKEILYAAMATGEKSASAISLSRNVPPHMPAAVKSSK